MTAEYTQFYVEYYMNGVTANMTEEKEKALKMRWPVPPGDFGMAILSTNATIVDKGGKILAWVLPGVLSAERQVSQVSKRAPYTAHRTPHTAYRTPH